MLRWISGCCAAWLLAAPALPAEVLPPVSERFGTADGKEAVSFQRHVVPLLGRLGCSGRACHGSFQGRGGFRLSLFGYDFQKDHEALTGSRAPRVDPEDPDDSLILQKPTLTIPHKGGQRLKPGSWQYHALRRWIRDGARNDAVGANRLVGLSVSPDQHVFREPGEKLQLRVFARWSDGTAEDVTELARFRSNNDAVATIDESGVVTGAGKGDTHVVAFYDNGVTPIPVMLPVSDQVGARYPDLPMPTQVDRLVGAKLRRCGIVPSDLATDAEFLRRVSLDLTGTLPTSAEVEGFLADRSADKRTRKIDELLARPAHAIWWATRLCDYTGNSGLYRERRFGPDYARQWYEWVHRRVKENVGYDQIVAGIVLASGRKPGQSLEDYSREMSSYVRADNPADFSRRETMPHFWARFNIESPKEKALAFSYSFLGVQLQCAQCHKHPFDQWTQKDFEQFTLFFDRIVFGTPPEDREEFVRMAEAVCPTADGKAGKNREAALSGLVREGKIIPWSEVYIGPPGDNGRIKGNLKPPAAKKASPKRALPPRLLGDAELPVDSPADLRGDLMTWLRRPDHPYFARAFVNRVWANYFNVGIIEPPDDLSLANPPSNAALLDYLTRGFVAHGYDMKWLHREIITSRTYQLSWKPNDTNRLDARNFSHAIPRRLHAEVIYDAIYQAAAPAKEIAAWQGQPNQRAIGIGKAAQPKAQGKYGNILTVFGKPDRLTNCDCGRSNDPSLLQTLFLLNDPEIQALLNRPGGWVAVEFGRPSKPGKPGKRDPAPAGPQAGTVTPARAEKLISEAFLRTLSRTPTDREATLAGDYLNEAVSPQAGMRDLLWALINTDEFLVNH
jgi:hypothetical protein